MEINTRMKKYHHYLTLLSLFMLLGILKLQAAIQLPAIFSNHMVLQRNSELTFWGWGIPGETISIAPEPKSIIRGNGQPVYLPAKPADLMRFVSAARQK